MAASDDDPLGPQLLGWLIVCVGLGATIVALRPFVFYFLPSLPLVLDAPGGAFLRVYARSLLGDLAVLALQATVVAAGVGTTFRRGWARAWVTCLALVCLGEIAHRAWLAGGPADELAQWRAFAAAPGWVAGFGLVPATIPPATALASLAALVLRRQWWSPTRGAAWRAAFLLVSSLVTLSWWTAG